MDGDLADSPDTVVELEVFDQHWITDEEVGTELTAVRRPASLRATMQRQPSCAAVLGRCGDAAQLVVREGWSFRGVSCRAGC